MKEYKYVKFSLDTAKINSEMIVREYEDLIEKNTITTFDSLINPLKRELKAMLNISGWDETLKLLKNKQKKKIANKLVSAGANIYKKLAKLPLIEKEFKQFKKEFKIYLK